MNLVSSAIETFDSRLIVLEEALGDFGDVDLHRAVELMTVKVRRMFYQGQNYSEQLMGLLDGFSENKTIDAFERKFRVVMSCYEGLKRSLKDLDQLESLMGNLDKTLEAAWGKNSVVELDSVKELPNLMNKCNSLLVHSILVARRFMEINLRFNEFWISADQRLDRLG